MSGKPSRGRVLVVDDDVVVAQYFARTLIRHGLEVQTAVGLTMAERLTAWPPDVVLMETRFDGGMDGIDLVSRHWARGYAPVVFVSAESEPPVLERARAVGPLGYLVKPVSPLQLATSVDFAVRRARLERAIIGDELQTQRAAADTQLRDLIDAAEDGILVADVDGRILIASRALEEMFGYEAGALVGLQVEALVPMAARGTHVAMRGTYTARPQVRRMGATSRLLGCRANGSELPVDVSLTPVGSGAHIRVIAVVRDGRVAREVERTRSESRALAEQLARIQKLDAIGQLAGGVAHDFNNLLTIIGGYAEVLAADDRLDEPTSGRMLEGIRKAVDRGASLTRQLLAFGRRQVLQPRVIDLNETLTSTGDMLTRLIGENIQLQLVRDPALAPVRFDPGQMDQIIVNLAVNARDAMPDGGRLTIETRLVERPSAAEFSATSGVVPPGRYVCLTVEDTGMGMDPATLARVYEPFFTTKDPSKGTGLGLSTVYGIVKQSGGYIRIDTAPGVGTAVAVLIPAVDEPLSPPESAVSRTQAISLRAGTILVVEDEQEVRDLIVDTLRSAGHRVCEAADGDAGLSAIYRPDGSHFDLVVTDVVMPRFSGPAMVKAARVHLPHLKVIYISGYADRLLPEPAGPAEPLPVILQKPFSREGLLAAVAELLGRDVAD